MAFPETIRNSKWLRRPLLSASKFLLTPLKAGPAILRRAAYDAMPLPYLVTGDREIFIVSTADKVIGRELFLHGEFDFRKMETAIAILEREGQSRPRHLIDVGANIGTIVIPALKRGLMQTATAIEPHPGNLKLLHANLALNSLTDQVNVLGIAIGAQADKTLFLKESPSNGGNHSISDNGIQIHSTRLDDLDVQLDGSLLWMDIEGYEGHALQGASRLLAAGVPVVSEFNPRFLSESGGISAFFDLLKQRRIFDLAESSPRQTSLDELKARYAADWTDILALPA